MLAAAPRGRRSAAVPQRLLRNDQALRQFIHDEFYAYQMLTPTRAATGKPFHRLLLSR